MTRYALPPECIHCGSDMTNFPNMPACRCEHQAVTLRRSVVLGCERWTVTAYGREKGSVKAYEFSDSRTAIDTESALIAEMFRARVERDRERCNLQNDARYWDLCRTYGEYSSRVAAYLASLASLAR